MRSLILLGLGTLVTWGMFAFVIMRFDPFVAGGVSHMLFYVSLGLALQGTFMLSYIGIYSLSRESSRRHRHRVGIIARQSFLMVAFVLIMLLLASRDLLTWWNMIPLVLLILAIEIGCASLYRTHDPLERARL